MSKVPTDFEIKGVIAAPGTGLKDNGDLNPDIIPRYVDFLSKNGVDGVFVLGTLGEGLSLTVQERKDAATAWVHGARGKLSSVIVHVGAGNIRDTMELARHAGQAGATAIACMLPSYFKPASEELAVKYLEQVAKEAPDTPFYYYCINFMSGIYLDTARILQLSKSRIPNLRGAKISSRELPSLMDATQVPGMQVMVGTDEQFLPCLSLGIRVPVLNGFLGNIYQRCMGCYDKGDIEGARKEMLVARRLVKLRDTFMGGPALVKAIMTSLGVPLGPVRLPLQDLPQSLMADLKAELKDAGLPVVD